MMVVQLAKGQPSSDVFSVTLFESVGVDESGVDRRPDAVCRQGGVATGAVSDGRVV